MRLPKKQKKMIRRVMLFIAVITLVLLVQQGNLLQPKQEKLEVEKVRPTPRPTTTVAPTRTFVPTDVVRRGIVRGNSNFRNAPNFYNQSIVTTIPEGTEVILIRLEGPFWYVSWDGMHGYIGRVMIIDEVVP